MFISGESSRPLIKESFANAFRKSVRTAGVVADAHPCLLASTRAVDRLGRIAGHAERERYYNVYLRYYFTRWADAQPSILVLPTGRILPRTL